MRNQLVRVAWLVACAGLIAAAVAVAKPVNEGKFVSGNLFLRDNSGLVPTKLPRHGLAPAAARLFDEIGTLDGSHPPAIRHVEADFDKSIRVDAVGLPVCSKSKLAASSAATVRKACAGAIVGTGSAEVEVEFPEQPPFRSRGPITLFNGGVRDGITTVYVHAYVDVPAPTAIVTTAKVTRIHKGHYGVHVVADIPPIAGGSGSPINFEFTIQRNFVRAGKEVSFLSAGCPTGHYYAEGKVLFGDDSALHIAHILPCTPTG